VFFPNNDISLSRIWQYGVLGIQRNTPLALPNAAFIGFTGTPNAYCANAARKTLRMPL
jgi:type I site-specific restriction-modification system R (restriction) subunit